MEYPVSRSSLCEVLFDASPQHDREQTICEQSRGDLQVQPVAQARLTNPRERNRNTGDTGQVFPNRNAFCN